MSQKIETTRVKSKNRDNKGEDEENGEMKGDKKSNKKGKR
jgi:hypothetical protein